MDNVINLSEWFYRDGGGDFRISSAPRRFDSAGYFK